MAKQVSFGVKPNPKPVDLAKADEWVNSQPSTQADQMKRLTIDISVNLHARIKSQCALKGTKMNDAIREILEKHFPPNG